MSGTCQPASAGLRIVHGDASNQVLLTSEGLESSDALVTLTGLDELNMIISLYGNACGIPQVITKVGHLENNDLLDSLSLGSVICPKDLCSNTIVRYVRAMKKQEGAAPTIHSIADGQAEAIEFMVDDQTLHCGEPLKAIHLKRNVLIACIIHGSRTEIPAGDSVFSLGDTLIIVSVSPSGHLSAERYFRGLREPVDDIFIYTTIRMFRRKEFL